MTGEEINQEGRRRKESSRDGGTHSKSDRLDWHACWPSTLSSLRFSVSLKHTAVFSVAPCKWYRACGPPLNVNTDTYTHAQTHTHTHTRVSMVGGEIWEGGG